jgi:ribosomal protein L7/L12
VGFDVLLVIDDLKGKHVQVAATLRKFIPLTLSEALKLVHQPQVVIRQDASHYQEQLNFQRALKRIGVRSHIERVKPD